MSLYRALGERTMKEGVCSLGGTVCPSRTMRWFVGPKAEGEKNGVKERGVQVEGRGRRKL